jgi:hypothetical protein
VGGNWGLNLPPCVGCLFVVLIGFLWLVNLEVSVVEGVATVLGMDRICFQERGKQLTGAVKSPESSSELESQMSSICW